jgi:hypothetical protein
MPRKRKDVNEMTDREIMEDVFGKRVVRRLYEEFDLRDPENDSDTGSTPTDEDSS